MRGLCQDRSEQVVYCIKNPSKFPFKICLRKTPAEAGPPRTRPSPKRARTRPPAIHAAQHERAGRVMRRPRPALPPAAPRTGGRSQRPAILHPQDSAPRAPKHTRGRSTSEPAAPSRGARPALPLEPLSSSQRLRPSYTVSPAGQRHFHRKPLAGRRKPRQEWETPAGPELRFHTRVWPVLGHPRASTLKISHASGFCTRKAPPERGAGTRGPRRRASGRPARSTPACGRIARRNAATPQTQPPRSGSRASRFCTRKAPAPSRDQVTGLLRR